MQNKNKNGKNFWGSYNIYYFVCLCCVALLVSIAVLGGYLLHHVYRTVYEDYLLGNEQHITNIVERHENDMQIVDNIVIQMNLTDEVTRFMLTQDTQKMLNLKQQLKGYTVISNFFDVLFYYYHRDEYLYNYSTSVRLDRFLNSGCMLGNQTAEELEVLMSEEVPELRILPEQTIRNSWLYAYLSGGNQYILMFRTIPATMEDTLLFIIPGTYYDRLLGDNLWGDCKDFLIYDGEIIVSRGNEQISSGELMEMFAAENLSPESLSVQDSILQKKVSIGDQDFFVSVQKGKSGIIYGTVQSMKYFRDRVILQLCVVIILIVLCLVSALLLIFVVSRRFVRKVKSLNLLLNEESYGLDTIEIGIQTLVTNYNESEKEHFVHKKARFVRWFVRGDCKSRQDAVANATMAGMQIDRSMFSIVLIKEDVIDRENKVYIQILEMIAGNESVEGYGIHTINNNQNLFLLFGDSKEDLNMILEKILEIEKSYCEDYVIAVSDYHMDFTEGAKAYLEVVTAFDNHLLLDNTNIIRFSNLTQMEFGSPVPEKYLQRLRTAIRSKDKNSMEIVVYDICSKISNENMSLYAFRIFINEIIHILMSEWGYGEIQGEKFYDIFSLAQCMNVQDFRNLLCEICHTIIEKRDEKQSKHSDIVEEAIVYMQKNYGDSELTMSSVAEQLGISSVILSKEFKNVMDVNPFTYLTNFRMERAKDLLRSTNLQIMEIRTAVGYVDERGFGRRFKQYTGMTPGEYREKKKKEGNDYDRT